MNLVLIAFIVVVSLVIIVRIARRITAQIEKINASEKKQKGITSALGNIHGWYGVIAFVFPALKRVYTSWKKAPDGSIEQLGWGLLLSLIAAIGIWLVIMLTDKVINRQPYQPKMVDGESTEYMAGLAGQNSLTLQSGFRNR
ncbi:MAG: hypothetical protein ABFD46_09550 [Armatimonadota bacterium]